MANIVREWVCPRCGTSSGDNRFCGGCGLELSSQYELPSKEAWEARQAQTESGNGTKHAGERTSPPDRSGSAPVPTTEPVGSIDPNPSRTTAASIGLALSLVGGALIFAASFLHWLSAFDETATAWQIADASDIVLAVLTVAIGAAAVLVFLRGNLLAARFASVALGAGVVAWGFSAIEYMALSEGELSTVEAGEIVTLAGAVALLVGVILQITFPLFEPGSARPPGSLLLIGLIMLAVAGFTEPLIALLPIDSGTSAWEALRVSDITGTVLDACLVTIALAAIFVADTRLLGAAFLLGSYVAISNLAGSIESLAQSYDGSGVFLQLFLTVPLAAAGAVLIAAAASKRIPKAS